MSHYFISGIGTDVGKTVVSSILVEALQADYWKPVQCGGLDTSDTDRVRSLVSSKITQFHPEAYRLAYPASPLQAARHAGITLRPSKLAFPKTSRPLIVECSGGLMVPFNSSLLLTDILSSSSGKWIIVSRHYLGSINHTLLSVEFLKQRRINVKGIIFNGTPLPGSEEFILGRTHLPCLGRLRQEHELTPAIIKEYAQEWKTCLQEI